MSGSSFRNRRSFSTDPDQSAIFGGDDLFAASSEDAQSTRQHPKPTS